MESRKIDPLNVELLGTVATIRIFEMRWSISLEGALIGCES